MALQLQFSGKATVGDLYDDCSIRVSRSATAIMYIEKLMMIISIYLLLCIETSHVSVCVHVQMIQSTIKCIITVLAAAAAAVAAAAAAVAVAAAAASSSS